MISAVDGGPPALTDGGGGGVRRAAASRRVRRVGCIILIGRSVCLVKVGEFLPVPGVEFSDFALGCNSGWRI